MPPGHVAARITTMCICRATLLSPVSLAKTVYTETTKRGFLLELSLTSVARTVTRSPEALVARRGVALALQQSENEVQMLVHESLDAVLMLELFKMRVEDLLRKDTELGDCVGRRAVDHGDSLGKVVVFPRFTLRRFVLELRCGEVAEAVDRIFNGHGEDFDVPQEEVLRLVGRGSAPLLILCRHFDGISRIIEMVEVVHHELHNLRIIVELVVGVFGIVLDKL